MKLKQKCTLFALLGIVGSVNAQELQPSTVAAVPSNELPRFEVKPITKQETRKSQAVVTNQVSLMPVKQHQFEGWAVYGSIGYGMNNIKYSPKYNVDGISVSSKDSGMATKLGVEYGIPVGQSFLATVGASYSFNDLNFEEANIQDVNIIEAELKNRMSFYFAPGYKVTPDWLVYGKISYEHAKGTYADNYSIAGAGIKFGKEEKTFSGIGYGVGTAITVLPNLENSIEVQHTSYDKFSEVITTSRASVTEIMASLKYRF